MCVCVCGKGTNPASGDVRGVHAPMPCHDVCVAAGLSLINYAGVCVY